MVRIGLIADTHGMLRPQVATVFAGVDRILHAGDVGGRAVLEGLGRIAPVDAVYGNIDDRHDPALAAERVLTIGGVTIHVSPGDELGRARDAFAIARHAVQLVFFGYTLWATRTGRRSSARRAVSS
jgi:putative phosphoesterase